MRTQFLKRLSFLCCLSMALFGGTFHAAAASQLAFISPTNAWKYNDEAIDLGSAWRAASYNDSAWSNGLAAIGFAGLGSTNESLPPPNFIRTLPRKNIPGFAQSNIMTFYFRAHFNLTAIPGGMILTASNLIDDGAVFYLNGFEVGRVALPEGDIGWGTQALRNDDIGTSRIPTVNTHGYDVFTIPIDALVQGDNVMAVEVHQSNSGSSDFAFQTELWAIFPDPTQLTITNQPQDVSLEEGKRVETRVGVSGAGASYQWYRRSGGSATPVPGAISERLLIPVAATNDTGIYFVVVSNSVNSVTSRDVQITIVSDVTGPILVDADGSLSTTNVLVSFADPVLASTATNLANYRITNTLGGLLVVTRAVLSNATNVLLTATNARLANNNYVLIVNGVRDTSLRTNLIVTNSMIPVSNLATNIVGFGASPWRYYDPFSTFPLFEAPNLGTNWRQVTYTETNNWADGGSVFFYSENGTVPAGVPLGTSLSQTSEGITYFRYRIPGQFSSGNQKFFLTHVIDDGAVIYLNGTEVFRLNLPAAPATISYNTRATTAVGTPTRSAAIPLTGPFISSGNVVAVELHQNAVNDLDKFFGLQIDANVRSVGVGPVIITGGPSDITGVEGQPATFSVVQVGGTGFQWQRNNANIPGATGDSYTLTNPVAADTNATFRVLVSGASGTVTSTNARLRLVTDTDPPRLVSAFANANSIVVSFSENVGAATATATGNYTVTNSAGQSFTANGASLNGTDVTLSFASLPAAQYFVVVNNVRDASTTGNLIAPNSAVKVGFNATVIDYAGTWRYEQSGLDLRAQGWTNRTFNDGAWLSGPGLLDGKSGAARTLPFPVGTVILAPTNGPGGRFLTNTYFRGHFNSYGSGTGEVTFSTFVDDGYVMYLNGVEMRRTNMPAGTVTAATFASAGVTDGTNQGPHTFTATNLVAGDNVIAVEVHQNALGSSDVTWGGQFSVSIPSMLLSTNIGPCVPNPLTPPRLAFQRASGTNVVLSWTNPTDSCGSLATFTLQQTLALSNTMSATVWSDVTSVSPYTAVGTNTSRFFRLKR